MSAGVVCSVQDFRNPYQLPLMLVFLERRARYVVDAGHSALQRGLARSAGGTYNARSQVQLCYALCIYTNCVHMHIAKSLHV